MIIGHASVIRCILAYLIGLPASEIPAIEVARGDLIEVVPTSYGVQSQAFHSGMDLVVVMRVEEEKMSTTFMKTMLRIQGERRPTEVRFGFGIEKHSRS